MSRGNLPNNYVDVYSYESLRNAENLRDYLISDNATEPEIGRQSNIIDYRRNLYQGQVSVMERAKQNLAKNCNINRYKVESLIHVTEILRNSTPNDLLVFDFDDTLVGKKGNLWLQGALRYNPTRDTNNNFNDLIPYPGFDEFIELSKTRPTIILTKRNSRGVLEIENLMLKYGLKIPVVGTIDDGDTMRPKVRSKGEVLMDVLALNPPYSSVYFIDDTYQNVDSVRDHLSKYCPYTTNVNLIDLDATNAFNPNLSDEEMSENQQEYLFKYRA